MQHEERPGRRQDSEPETAPPLDEGFESSRKGWVASKQERIVAAFNSLETAGPWLERDPLIRLEHVTALIPDDWEIFWGVVVQDQIDSRWGDPEMATARASETGGEIRIFRRPVEAP